MTFKAMRAIALRTIAFPPLIGLRRQAETLPRTLTK